MLCVSLWSSSPVDHRALRRRPSWQILSQKRWSVHETKQAETKTLAVETVAKKKAKKNKESRKKAIVIPTRTTRMMINVLLTGIDLQQKQQRDCAEEKKQKSRRNMNNININHQRQKQTPAAKAEIVAAYQTLRISKATLDVMSNVTRMEKKGVCSSLHKGFKGNLGDSLTWLWCEPERAQNFLAADAVQEREVLTKLRKHESEALKRDGS